MILLFVPETKDLTLEQLDQVFGFATKEHMRYGMDELRWWISRYILRRKGGKKPVFLHEEDPEEVFDTRGEMMDMRGSVEYEEVLGERSARQSSSVFVS